MTIARNPLVCLINEKFPKFELYTTVVLWSDWLAFCDCGFSLSALWCPLATPTVLLGFLWPCTWGISSRLLQQSTATAPYLGREVSPHGHPSWPWMWSSSSQLSCACAAAAPWRWGSSSRARPLISRVGKLLSAAAPALSRPGALGRYPWPWARGSSSRPRFCEVCCSQPAYAAH